MDRKEILALLRDGTVPSKIKLAKIPPKFSDLPLNGPEWDWYMKASKPVRIATTEKDKNGNCEYLQQGPYGDLEIGWKENEFDHGACWTMWEFAQELMEKTGRQLNRNKLPFQLHKRHIEEIKRMKLHAQ